MQGCSFPSISKLAIGLAGSLFVSGCTGPGRIPAPTAKNVELAGRHGEVTTLPTLMLGRKLYISRCSSCHGLKAPGFLTPAEWPEMVARMADNAKVNADQQRAITQYLVSVSAATHDSSAAPATPQAGPPPAAD